MLEIVHQYWSYKLVILSISATGLLSACTGSVTETVHHRTESDSSISASNKDSIAVLDTSIPLTASYSYWYLKEDLKSLSDTSALGFVGRITGYVERIKTLPNSSDTPAEDRGYDVYDGIVFTVDELLTGEIPASSNIVTVAVRTLVLNPDSTIRFRIWEDPMDTIKPGIEARSRLRNPSYIVYLTEDTEERSPFYGSGYYFFNTPGGVAPMLDEERIGYAEDVPLARPVTVEDGEYRQIDHELTLDDARAVGRVVESDNSTTSTVTPGTLFDTQDEPGP